MEKKFVAGSAADKEIEKPSVAATGIGKSSLKIKESHPPGSAADKELEKPSVAATRIGKSSLKIKERHPPAAATEVEFSEKIVLEVGEIKRETEVSEKKPTVPKASEDADGVRSILEPIRIPVEKIVEERAEALKAGVNFNMSLFGLIFLGFTFSVLSLKSVNGQGKCNPKRQQFPLLITLEVLSFGLLCGACGLTAIIIQRMKKYCRTGGLTAKRNSLVKWLAWIVVVLSTVGVVMLEVGLVLSAEMKIGKFYCQETWVKVLIIVACLFVGVGSIGHSNAVIDLFTEEITHKKII